MSVTERKASFDTARVKVAIAYKDALVVIFLVVNAGKSFRPVSKAGIVVLFNGERYGKFSAGIDFAREYIG